MASFKRQFSCMSVHCGRERFWGDSLRLSFLFFFFLFFACVLCLATSHDGTVRFLKEWAPESSCAEVPALSALRVLCGLCGRAVTLRCGPATRRRIAAISPSPSPHHPTAPPEDSTPRQAERLQITQMKTTTTTTTTRRRRPFLSAVKRPFECGRRHCRSCARRGASRAPPSG